MKERQEKDSHKKAFFNGVHAAGVVFHFYFKCAGISGKEFLVNLKLRETVVYLLLLVNALVIAVLSMPTMSRVFHNEPADTLHISSLRQWKNSNLAGH